MDQKRFSFLFILVLFLAVGVLLVGTCGTTAENSTTDRVKTPAVSTENVSEGCEIAQKLSEAFESATEKINQSVVPIFAEQEVVVQNPFSSPTDPFRDFFGDDLFRKFFGTPGEGQKRTVRSMGSGVIVSKDGYILTNNHVVKGAEKLTVVMTDGKKYTAKVIGTDPQPDVAVIKIADRNLPAAVLGDSDQVKVGQWVIAVGNPFQLLHTATAGIISAKGRSSMGLADYEDFIQTDAAINPGNSGGALADLDGRVIGINTAINSPSGGNVGIGFAIPINMARGVMEKLIADGKVSRGYLGVLSQDIDENLAKALNLKQEKGSLVGDVVANGPADRAGIKRGDVITGINGKPVENSSDLRLQVAQAQPGKDITVTLIRDGKEKDVQVKLAERPADRQAESSAPARPETQSYEKLGLSVQNLTPDIARQLGYKNEKGVVILAVSSGSPAEDAGLRRGDLIKEVNRIGIESVNQFKHEIGRISSGDSAALLVRRGNNNFFVALVIP
jgi:serine protease Do